MGGSAGLFQPKKIDLLKSLEKRYLDDLKNLHGCFSHKDLNTLIDGCTEENMYTVVKGILSMIDYLLASDVGVYKLDNAFIQHDLRYSKMLLVTMLSCMALLANGDYASALIVPFIILAIQDETSNLYKLQKICQGMEELSEKIKGLSQREEVGMALVLNH